MAVLNRKTQDLGQMRKQYAAVHNRKVGRSISELVRVLEALRTGDAVAAGWQPGQPTLGP